MRRGEAEADVALDARLDGAGEDLAVREVFLAVARDPCAPLDADGEIRALGDDAQLLLRPEPPGEARELLPQRLPGRDRVLLVEEARAVDEVLVVRERHLGVLRRGVGRKGRDDPPELAGGGALHRHVAQVGARAREDRLPGGIDAGQRARVRLGLDRDPDGRLLGVAAQPRADPAELLVVPAREQSLHGAVEADPHLGMPAGLDDPAVERGHERPGEGRGLDEHEVALPHARRVVDEDLREPLVAGIRHARPPRRGPAQAPARGGTGRPSRRALRRRTPRRPREGRRSCPSEARTCCSRRPG